MKKFILTIAVALLMTLSFSSCSVQTYATTQDDIYTDARAVMVQPTVDFSVVLQYGTPCYHNGALLYYSYDGLYYYPYWYRNQWYVRCYRKPFTHLIPQPYFRPSRYDIHFRPGIYQGYGVPRVNRNTPPPPATRRPNATIRKPNENPKPNVGNRRVPARQSSPRSSGSRR